MSIIEKISIQSFRILKLIAINMFWIPSCFTLFFQIIIAVGDYYCLFGSSMKTDYLVNIAHAFRNTAPFTQTTLHDIPNYYYAYYIPQALK